jgi:hypothetical protein
MVCVSGSPAASSIPSLFRRFPRLGRAELMRSRRFSRSHEEVAGAQQIIRTDTSALAYEEASMRRTIPPFINRVTPSQSHLWPPNHRRVPIEPTVDAVDRVTPSPIDGITAVTSKEPGRRPDLLNCYKLTVKPLALSMVTFNRMRTVARHGASGGLVEWPTCGDTWASERQTLRCISRIWA